MEGCDFPISVKPLYDLVGEFLLSKCCTNKFKKTYNPDLLTNRPGIVKIQNLVALDNVNKELQEIRKDAEIKKNDLKQQWEVLAANEEDFRKNFEKFELFVQENDAKRIRLLEDISHLKNLQQERNASVANLNETYEKLLQKKELMVKKISEYSIFENYLQSVCAEYPDLPNIQTILNRYEALSDARSALCDNQLRIIIQLEEEQTYLGKLIDSELNKVLQLKNKLSEIFTRFEDAKQNCLKWENVCLHVKNAVCKKLLDISLVEAACNNLYVLSCHRKKLKPNLTVPFERKFQFIHDALKEVKHANKVTETIKTQEESS